MKLEDNLMIQFLKKFDENPFLIKINGKEVLVGEGEPTFVVRFNKSLDIKELRRSTSLALGEAAISKWKATFFRRLISFWARWINFLWKNLP